MIDWLLNPSGVSYVWYVILWIGLLVMLPVAIIVGVFRAVLEWRERKDGVKPKRVHR
jgi:uncharacterized membrane protein